MAYVILLTFDLNRRATPRIAVEEPPAHLLAMRQCAARPSQSVPEVSFCRAPLHMASPSTIIDTASIVIVNVAKSPTAQTATLFAGPAHMPMR